MKAGPGLLEVTYTNHSRCQSPKNSRFKSIKKIFNTSWDKKKGYEFKEKLVKWLMASIEDFYISNNSL